MALAALPPLFGRASEEVTRTPFQRGDQPRLRRMAAPGAWFDQTRHDYDTGVVPIQTHIMSSTLGGANTSPQVWRVTVRPLKTRHGSAAADWIGEAFIEGIADGGSLEDMVDILVAAADVSATLTTQASVSAWKRLRSIVILSKDATTPEKLVATSVSSGQTFDLVITPGAAGTATAPAIDQNGDPELTTVTVGSYVAVSGRDKLGRLQIRPPQAGDLSSDLVGPVLGDQGTEAVDPGYTKQVFRAGTNVPLASYGHPLAYGEGAIGAGATPEARATAAAASLVFVRLAAGGALEPGFVTDAAGAAIDATPTIWTMTPVAQDTTLYQLQVTYRGIQCVLSHLSDGSATATEIADGQRAELALKNGAGQPLEGLAGTGTTTFIMTSATGEVFTPVSMAGSGDMGEDETQAGAPSHILAPRGEKFVTATTRTGGAPVGIPHP